MFDSRTTTGGSDISLGERSRSVVKAVVVTFCPDRERFSRLVSATRPQVDAIVVVDNGSTEAHLTWLRTLRRDQLRLIELGRNTGIATAQNVGIAAARSDRCDYVLLLDHDSIPDPDMVAQLLEGVLKARRTDGRIAAVGPRYVDPRRNIPPPFIRIRGLRVVRCQCRGNDDVIKVDYLIASGSLIPVSAFDQVGLMREELFIDYVDIEWGLRARNQGYQSYGVCAARMSHDLGEMPIRFLGMNFPLHSPLRHYYHVRNAVALYQNDAMPIAWKFADGLRLALKYGFYSLFARPRLVHLRMMTRGLRDGLRGRLGPFDHRSDADARPAPRASR